jgi:hypothetical protein
MYSTSQSSPSLHPPEHGTKPWRTLHRGQCQQQSSGAKHRRITQQISCITTQSRLPVSASPLSTTDQSLTVVCRWKVEIVHWVSIWILSYTKFTTEYVCNITKHPQTPQLHVLKGMPPNFQIFHPLPSRPARVLLPRRMASTLVPIQQ